ncbi:MAG: phosphatidate cytidylyltransferase [Acidimicrobiales bacterium]
MVSDMRGPSYEGWGPGGGPPEDYDPQAATGPLEVPDGQGAASEERITKPTRLMGYPRGVPGKMAAGELTIRVSTGENSELPHWTDPPTGEVPSALAGGQVQGASEDEMAAWRLLGSRSVRWRDDMNDWADEPSVADLVGEDGPLAASADDEAGQYSFDEDFQRLEREHGVPAGDSGAYEATTIAMASPTPGRGAEQDSAPGERGAGPARSTAKAARNAKVRGDVGGAAPTPGANGGLRLGGRARHAKAAGPGEVAVAGARRTGTAVLAGVVMVAVLVACYVLGRGALLALATVVVFGCVVEVLSMFQGAGFRPATLVAAIGSAGAVLAAYWRGEPALPLVFVVVTGASLVWYLAKVVEARPVVNVAVTLLAFAWVGALGSYAGLLLKAHDGKHLFLAAVIPAVAADIVAWFVGSRFGQHALAPAVSPSKTWEGLLAGGFAAVVAGVVIGKNLAPWGGLKHGLELGVLIAVVGPLGDLVQSMVKRDLHLKDSGHLLPGHGGLFDRFDSLLFALPATYYLAIVLHLA